MVSEDENVRFIITEYGTDVTKELLKRGIPKKFLDCTDTNGEISACRYSVIDMAKLSIEEVSIDRDSIILCVNATKENIKKVVEKFDAQIVIPFNNLEGCIEFMYINVAQSAYGAFMDFDLGDIIDTLGIRYMQNNSDIKVVHCTDILQLKEVPEDVKVFVSNVVYSYDDVFALVGTGKLIKILEMFREDSRAAIVVSPMKGSYQKIFWSE